MPKNPEGDREVKQNQRRPQLQCVLCHRESPCSQCMLGVVVF